MVDANFADLDIRGAEAEIAWYYGNAARVLGVRAQQYDTDGGGGADPHMRLHGKEHREEMATVQRVERILDAIGGRRVTLDIAHEPCGWPAQQRRHFTRPATKVCLGQLALLSRAAIKGRDKRHKRRAKQAAKRGEAPPPLESVADFIFWEAGLNDSALRVADIVAEVKETFEGALRAYVVAGLELADEDPGTRVLRMLFGDDKVAIFGAPVDENVSPYNRVTRVSA